MLGEELTRIQPLSAQQRVVLRLIQKFFDDNREPPTIEFLSRQTGLHRKTTREHIYALYRKGWLRSPAPGGFWCRIT